MNLPNKLTLFRGSMIPFFVLFMLVNIFGGPDNILLWLYLLLQVLTED